MWGCMWYGRCRATRPALRQGYAPCTAAENPGSATLGSLHSPDPLCALRETYKSGHTLHGGRTFTCVYDCVRARRCTIVHQGRRRGSTGQRRVPALHSRAQRTPVRTPRQRRVPRALVHRGKPRGWALVAGGGGWKHPTTRPPAPPAARALPGCGWRVVLAARVVASGNDVPKGHECAAGAARALPGCGWRVVLAAASSDISTRHHQPRAPSPVASPDAQVREGPGAAVGSAPVSFVHPCAALGPAAASCSHGVVMRVRVCSDGRARSHTHT
jgi:hypothetical protein